MSEHCCCRLNAAKEQVARRVALKSGALIETDLQPAPVLQCYAETELSQGSWLCALEDLIAIGQSRRSRFAQLDYPSASDRQHPTGRRPGALIVP